MSHCKKHQDQRRVWPGLQQVSHYVHMGMLGIVGLAAAGAQAQTIVGTIQRTSAFEYAATGLVTKEIIEPGNSELCVVNAYEYDSFGNRTKSTTRNCNGSTGNVAPHNTEAAAPAAGSKALFATRSVSTAYSNDGRFPIKNTNALNQSEDSTYDSRLGVPLSLTGPNGLTTKWAYDDWGRKVLEERADGTGTRWTYEYCASVTVNGAAGPATCPTIAGAVGAYVITTTPVKAPNATANTDGSANGPYGKTYYDGLGRVIRAVTQGFDGTASGGTTTAKLIYQDTEYNARGLVSRKSRPYFADAPASAQYWTEYTYDTLGRMVQEKSPDGSISKVEFAGLVTKSTNAKGQTRTETKNDIGQLVTVTDALNKNLTRSYDELGNLVKTTDALGNVTTLEYDLKGRKTKMIDPDMGTWTYVYNAIGELVQQTDAKAQVTTMTYDLLGRLTAKQEPSLNANWYYDKYKDASACAKGIGKLCEATSDNGYARKHVYDSLGRAQSTTTTIGGATYTSSSSYVNDTTSADHGRVKDVTYPTGTKLAYVYTPLGYTQKVVNAANISSVYWRQDSVDAEGHILQQTYGNNIVTLNTFDPKTGLLSTRKAGSAGSGAYQVQDATYGYDSIGNLTSQSDTPTSQSTTYGYDELNRLKNEVRLGSSVTTPATITWGYNEIGNITSRSDVGTYAYPASGATSVRPHALSSVAGTVNGVLNPSYAYDANGNITSTAGRSVTWTSFNKVNTITATSGSNTTVVALQYDAENERVKETVTKNGTLQKTIIYLNPGAGAGLFYEEETTPTGGTKQRHYISAGSGTIGVLTYEVAATKWTTQYWHKDHLGSTVAVTDQVGAVTERMAYEPFGKRRNVDGLTDLLGTLAPTTTSRGFTGHEMMDEVGLINMNGRIYDPAIGRFLSADPYIQAADNLQSYNRYSYVWNNPLNMTDPTGYLSLGKVLRNVMNISDRATRLVGRLTGTKIGRQFTEEITRGKYAYQIKSIGLSVGCAVATTGVGTAACVGASQAALAKAYGRSDSEAIATGIKAGATAYAMYQVGSTFNVSAEGATASTLAYNTLGHAAVGCASAAASGGNCGQGAAGAAIGAIASNYFSTGNVYADFATATVAGGLGSVAAGGKFEEGAAIAAAGYLFNWLAHVGVKVKVPLIGGASFGLGVSNTNGSWDAGVIIDSDIPVVAAGKLLGKTAVEVGLQDGDFVSNKGDQSLSIEAGYKAAGVSVQKSSDGRITGGAISIGPQLGVAVGGQQTRTVSIRNDVVPAVKGAIDSIKGWFGK